MGVITWETDRSRVEDVTTESPRPPFPLHPLTKCRCLVYT
jgi:hypothetical protein